MAYLAEKPYNPRDLFNFVRNQSGMLVAKRTVIPAASLPATTRYVHTVDLGNIGSPSALYIHCSTGSTTPIIATSTSGWIQAASALAPSAPTNIAGAVATFNSGVISALTQTIYVTSDYTATERLVLPVGGVIGTAHEQYGASLVLPYGKTYAEIGVGALFGFYTNGAASAGVLALNKKIHLQSVWLSLSGSNTILNIALYNNDSAAPSFDSACFLSAFLP